ncbi:polyphosphate kinase [Sphingomonas sp. Leaf231]|uniref:polyphosphate kinase 2 n=1 Tax=Sphingomonas sp. Leaf231 TaxID=1736301 RepID=UPI0006FE9DA5|nr:polyphosphate kinase 2 [Sphingomonas sp. Leaf231]KQN90954.1 polyphosphate kinase [Sphingomonas sp. Leaf231]
MSHDGYDRDLERAQLALVEAQVAAAASGERVVIVLEGRDSAGKDGAIKRIVEHLSVRLTRVVALPKPSDRERTQWYFQRYVAHLPAAGEIVIFNRSWYNRAGVEVVMGFSTLAEQVEFLRDAPDFERMLVESGIRLIKLWLDIGKDEQARRLKARKTDPLKQLKVSDMDAVAQDRWADYSAARDTMLMRTHTPLAPWHCVHADHKKAARLAILRYLVHAIAPATIAADVPLATPDVLFSLEAAAVDDGRLAP